jgi:hypothetical protein
VIYPGRVVVGSAPPMEAMAANRDWLDQSFASKLQECRRDMRPKRTHYFYVLEPLVTNLGHLVGQSYVCCVQT